MNKGLPAFPVAFSPFAGALVAAFLGLTASPPSAFLVVGFFLRAAGASEAGEVTTSDAIFAMR